MSHTLIIMPKTDKTKTIKSLSIQEFFTRNSQSQKEIKRGKLIDHEKVREKYKMK